VTTDGVERKLAAILSADVVGYSRLMAENEAATVRTLTTYREEVGVLVPHHRGRVVDFTGDNFLAEFPTALDAVECAVEVQRVLAVRNASLPEDHHMEFRIGVHLGDISMEGERVYGEGVNISARLEGLAEPGGVCISGTVQEQVRHKLEVGYEDLGEQSLKNISEPVRAYRVRPEAPVPTPMAEPKAKPRALLVAGVVVLLVVAGLLVWRLPTISRSSSPTDEQFTVPGFGDVPAIAVLPFDNLSGDPEQEYFADGLAEDLITRLSAIGFWPVIARNSSFSYKGEAVDVQQVGRELGARYVVEGSVRKAAGRVRVSAQLIDATNGHHVWAESYDRELRDIFELQDEITGAIVRSMGSKLRRSEWERAARAKPENLTVYDLGMRGNWHFNHMKKEHNAKARSLFEQAIELEPLDTFTLSRLAWVHWTDITFRWTDTPAASLSELERAAGACVAQDRQSDDCYIALSLVHQVRGQPQEQIAALEHAASLNLSSEYAHGWLGVAHALAARSEEAIEHLEVAMRLDPKNDLNWLWMNAMSWAHFAAGRYEAAIDWAQRSVRMNPANAIGYRALAASSAQAGRLDEARAALAEKVRVDPDFSIGKASVEAQITDPDFLERWLDGLRKAGWPE
jgi:adenylate cyclase